MSSPRAGTEHLHAVIHDGDGPVAFLTHGALGSRSSWDDNLGALKTVCRPVVIELWGHDRSPSPTDPEQYRPLSYVAEFERLADVVVRRSARRHGINDDDTSSCISVETAVAARSKSA